MKFLALNVDLSSLSSDPFSSRRPAHAHLKVNCDEMVRNRLKQTAYEFLA